MTLDKIYELLAGRIDALESKQYTTTPSWVAMPSEKIDAVQAEMRAGFDRVDKDMGLLRREMKNPFGEVSKLGAGH